MGEGGLDLLSPPLDQLLNIAVSAPFLHGVHGHIILTCLLIFCHTAQTVSQLLFVHNDMLNLK